MIPASAIPPVPPHLIAATLDRFCRVPAAVRDHRTLPEHALAAGATPDQARLVFIRLVALHAVFNDARWRPYRMLLRLAGIEVVRDIDLTVVAIIAEAPIRHDGSFASDDVFTALLAGIGAHSRA